MVARFPVWFRFGMSDLGRLAQNLIIDFLTGVVFGFCTVWQSYQSKLYQPHLLSKQRKSGAIIFVPFNSSSGIT